VVSSLEEIDCFVGDPVNQPVFLSDTPRPTTSEHIFQRFGLSRPFQWIPHDSLNKIGHSHRHGALVVDPIPEVLKKLGLKCGDSLRPSLHAKDPSVKRLLSQA
jgi:hypothetical protein